MRELGINVARIYHLPPRWFLDCCTEAGVRILITLPWAKHVEFLFRAKTRREIVRLVREAVALHAGHSAIFGYLVGNEIPTTMVRWLGVRRVFQFFGALVWVGPAGDTNILFSFPRVSPTSVLFPLQRTF